MSQTLCPNGPKHKWLWVRNFNQTRVTQHAHHTDMSVSVKGLYQCACGAERVGQWNRNGTDMRDLHDRTIAS